MAETLLNMPVPEDSIRQEGSQLPAAYNHGTTSLPVPQLSPPVIQGETRSLGRLQPGGISLTVPLAPSAPLGPC